MVKLGLVKGIIFVFILVISIYIVKADLMSSTNYNVTVAAVSSGGYNTTSTNYITNFITGGYLSGLLSSLNFNNFVGFFYSIFGGNQAPTQGRPILNATTAINRTSENITCYPVGVKDNENDNVTNITTWYLNGLPYSLLVYPFDTNVSTNTSNAIKDYSGRNNNGTFNGSNIIWNATGKIGGAYDFDGAEDYINTNTDFSWSNTSSFSILLWVRPYDVTTTHVMLSKTTWEYVLRTSGTQINFNYWDQAGATACMVVTANGILSQNQWTHIAVTYNGSIAKLYTGGTLQSSYESTIQCQDTTAKTTIGWGYRESGAYGYFNGTIDEVKILNRSLSANEIYQIYLEENNAFPNRTIVSSELSSNQNWICQLTPNDATQDGNASNSSVLTITSVEPTITNIILNATTSNNRTADNLTVYYSVTASNNDINGNFTDWRENTTSIALLNMPFDNNISTLGTGDIKDYSTTGNNGTLGAGTAANAPIWNASGKIGGSYTFDGVNDYIQMQSQNYGYISEWSAEMWINGKVPPVGYSRLWTFSTWLPGFIFALTSANAVRVYSWDNEEQSVTTTATVSNNEWHHIAFTWVGSSGVVSIYIDGSLSKSSTTTTNSFTLGTNTFLIGGPSNYYNGTIDEVRIYNRSLSADQVYQNYLAGVANHSNNILVGAETNKRNYNYSVLVGACNPSFCNTSLSQQLIILNTPPTTPSLIVPSNYNQTTNRTPFFNWTMSTDEDGDTILYDLFVRCFPGCGSDDRTHFNISTSNYTISQPLRKLIDNNYYYNWTVRAFDNISYSSNSSVYQVNISSLVSFNLNPDNITFGTLNPGDETNTSLNNPLPIVINNTGNCYVNISVNATSLWVAQPLNTKYYQFKVDNRTPAYTNGFNRTYSATSWTYMPPITSAVTAFYYVNYSIFNNTGVFDVSVLAPGGEPPGNKTSTINFLAYLAE